MPVSAASQDVLLRSLWLPASSSWADPPGFSSLWPVCGPSRPSTPPSGQGLIPTRAADLGFLVGAGEGNRTLMTSLEGWGSAIELRPRGGSNRQVQRTGFAMVVARRPD